LLGFANENPLDHYLKMPKEENKVKMKLKDLIKEDIKMQEFLNLLKPYSSKFKNSTAKAVTKNVNNNGSITSLEIVSPGFNVETDEIQYWINNHGQQFIAVNKKNKNLKKIIYLTKSHNININEE